MSDYLQLHLPYITALSESYPNIKSTVNEITKLSAILKLPKPTEHFMSDIHGEYEAFRHIFNNASGVIREKVDDLFGNTLLESDRESLATLIYYPKEKLEEIRQYGDISNEWATVTINRLLDVCELVSSKYTKARVRDAIDEEYADILLELIYADMKDRNKNKYYKALLETIVDVESEDAFIVAITKTIKRLVVDKLHIVGDIFDRGPRPDIIMDMLIEHHNVDIQWGNHDILWMGAGAGSRTCLLNALNISIRYDTLDSVEIGYGISLRPLAVFANEVYADVDVSCFMPKAISDDNYSKKDIYQLARMYKAVAIMLFKLEGQVILRNPQFKMEDRLLLNNIDYENKTINIDGKTYPLKDCDFPTIDPKDPYQLTKEELDVLNQLSRAFSSSEKLQKHIRFLYTNGSIYKVENGNLLFHGAIPMEENGEFTKFDIGGKIVSCKAYLDHVEAKARQGYYALPHTNEKKEGKDFLWFLWAGRNSPLFGRDRMTTFERLLLDDESTYKEAMNPYFKYNRDPEVAERILADFDLHGDHTHIINGHVPVKVKKGETPVHADGKVIVIDGGFCKAYQPKTGIAGYTLIFNSYGLRLIAHEPFKGTQDAIKNNTDILSASMIYETVSERITIGDTDKGKIIKDRLKGLKMLLEAYRSGLIKEKRKTR
ncbi:MAG: fructose-1,6-bisphosphatase [Christensenellaceae bacterium]|nr:fructose-1,6-bisphosphatase [Christensenellaceae bacterium]